MSSIRVGSGLTVHEGRKTGGPAGRWVAMCGAGANRTGRRVSAWGHPVGDEVPVDCKKCMKIQAARLDRKND